MNHKMTKIIALLIMFLVWPSFSLAAPNVSGVSSALSDGNEVTITGSSFGSAPNVVFFDDFESGTVGQPINMGPGSAKFGEWNQASSSAVDVTSYSTTAKLSGTKSFKTDFHPYGTWYFRQIEYPRTDHFFLSYWSYLPAGDSWPGANIPNKGINFKRMWTFGVDTNGTLDNDYTLPVQLDDATNPLGFNCVIGGNWSGAYYPGPGIFPKMYPPATMFKKGSWVRVWAWVKGSATQAGEIKLWYLDPTSEVKNPINKIGYTTIRDGVGFRRTSVPGYGRTGTPGTSNVYTDDVYVATGPNAQARVEVGNASTYTASTKLTILTPKSWTANSISAEVNKGNFPNGSAYLYVFDASGTPNTTGYPVTFGASGPDTTAPVVSSTAPTNNSTGITKNSINSILMNEDLNCSTVNTSSVTMSPNNIASVTCDNSVITITPQNQADSTTYTVTAGTAITNTAGLHLASPYTFSYTTATPAATCATDASLCQTATTCTASWPSNNFCSGETPACKSTPCASSCSQENWYLCTNETNCESNNLYWWENACRTIAEPQLWYGANLVTNPKLDTWSNGLPVGWSSYIPSGVYQDSLGARIVSRSGIHKPSLIEPDTTYIFAYNLPIVSGNSEIWYYNTSIFNFQAGTVTGSFTTPSEPISDHGFYFTSTVGSDIVINDIVLKRSTLTGCSTDPALCETEATCTAASWNYCDGVCKAEPCNADIPVAPCGLVVF